MPDDFRSTADLTTLRHRAALVAAVRSFFASRGFLEVETPLLCQTSVVDAHIDPFTVGQQDALRVLQTSPELSMKRLLASHGISIFQIGKAFRRGEVGRLHNPEFTMLEWYAVGASFKDAITLTVDLVTEVARAAGTASDSATEWPFIVDRVTYRELFRDVLGIDPLTASLDELKSVAESRATPLPDSFPTNDRDELLNWLLVVAVEPELHKRPAVILSDYPASQAALATRRVIGEHHGQPIEVADRFELYWQGVELANGYHELTDAEELAQRQADENRKRVANGLPELPLPGPLLSAQRSGLPECSGVALGFDRLVMLALGKSSLAEVIPFPWDRA